MRLMLAHFGFLSPASSWILQPLPTSPDLITEIQSIDELRHYQTETHAISHYNKYFNEPPVIAPPSGSTWQDYLGLPNPFNSEYFPMFQSLGIGSYSFRNNAPQGSLKPSLRGALATKQSSFIRYEDLLDCFASLAMTAECFE